jgi:hypothetical protein
VMESDGAEDNRTVMYAGGYCRYCDVGTHVLSARVAPPVKETEMMEKVRKECNVSIRARCVGVVVFVEERGLKKAGRTSKRGPLQVKYARDGA